MSRMVEEGKIGEPRGIADERVVDERTEHPKGALAFMLIYLAVLTALWLNAYMRLWQ